MEINIKNELRELLYMIEEEIKNEHDTEFGRILVETLKGLKRH
jgi:hypothetical protein